MHKEAGRQNLTEDKSSCIKESVLAIDLLAQQFNSRRMRKDSARYISVLSVAQQSKEESVLLFS